jgi:AAA15 family ATPase/GTPase
MERNKLISKITLTNFLSFGDESETIDLGPLNVLIGKNSCGKSNIIKGVGPR